MANFVDMFKIVRGYCQAKKIIRKFRPDVLFVKGGYVSLPVGRAAYKLGIPIVMHDSDVVPGLTNRILAKYATRIGTGTPVENYPNYEKTKTEFVGVPVDKRFFEPITATERREFLGKYGLVSGKKLVLVIGGGGGSEFLNELIFGVADEILNNDVQILLVAGKGKLDKSSRESEGFVAVEFIDGLVDAVRAADLVVSRAGASTLAELSAAGKPTVLIPHPNLSGNHQTKNTMAYAKKKAAVVMKQDDITEKKFVKEVLELLQDRRELTRMGLAIRNFARPDAIKRMVEMISEVGNGKKK